MQHHRLLLTPMARLALLPLGLHHRGGTGLAVPVDGSHSDHYWQRPRPGTLTLSSRQHFRLPLAALPVLQYPEPRSFGAAGRPGGSQAPVSLSAPDCQCRHWCWRAP